MGIRGFISLDVETANADFGSICAVGLAQFRDGEFVNQMTILVDPEDHFDPRNIAIHGIRPEDVAGKPTMAKVFPAIASQLTDTIVTHHSPFDRGALRRAASRYGVADLSCNWIDTVAVARRTWRELKGNGGYGLKSLSQFHGFQFRHHEAAEDARASGLIMLKALEDSGLDLEDWLDLLESKAPVETAVASRRTEVFARYARVGVEGGRLAGETIVFTAS
ncbi:MAG: 3'-5' exonuclease [Xanthobacteraceae bacterium]